MAEPIRTCIGCRLTDEQRRLVRVVLEPSGRATIDRERRHNGRGAYLHEARACVDKAVRNGGFPRSFRRKTQPLDGNLLWQQMVGR
jgi:predicted RNA-binding protein YlxR (DUF448 family)